MRSLRLGFFMVILTICAQIVFAIATVLKISKSRVCFQNVTTTSPSVINASPSKAKRSEPFWECSRCVCSTSSRRHDALLTLYAKFIRSGVTAPRGDETRFGFLTPLFRHRHQSIFSSASIRGSDHHDDSFVAKHGTPSPSPAVS